MRTSWATSARFHDAFDKGEKRDMETVLSDYGLPQTGFADDRTHFDVSEEIRRCKTCEVMKPVSHFTSQVQHRAGKNRTYYARECKECKVVKGEKRPVESDGKQYAKAMADAPIVAAVKLFEEHPEALALLIKHFREPYSALYKQERERVEAREEERLALMNARPQNLRS